MMLAGMQLGAATVIALFGLGIGCAPAVITPPPPSSPSRVLGAPLPTFRRTTLRGDVFDTSTVGGRVLVVDFFAAYCAPCQRTLPELETLHRARREIAVVGISLDQDPATAHRMVARHRLSFPVIHDPGSVLAGRFRVTELPASFVVDGRGQIRWAGGPGQPDDALERAVGAVAADPKPVEEKR